MINTINFSDNTPSILQKYHENMCIFLNIDIDNCIITPFLSHNKELSKYYFLSNFWQVPEPYCIGMKQYYDKMDIDPILVDKIINTKISFSEKSIMIAKAAAMKDIDTINIIIDTPEPINASVDEMKSFCTYIKNLGRKIINFNQDKWNILLPEVVFYTVTEKFKTDIMKQLIMTTDNNLLVEAASYDKIWGIGMTEKDDDIFNIRKWKGYNLLGYGCTYIRMCYTLDISEEEKCNKFCNFIISLR